MKFLLTGLLLLLNIICSADAGFSVRRKKAVSLITVSGTENLKKHKLIFLTRFYKNEDDLRAYANKGEIVGSDFMTSVQEGGRRWEESERNIHFILVDSLTGKITDSLRLVAKDFNLQVKISGDDEGKLQYKIDSTAALYQYTLLDNEDQPLAYRRNRLIFIACSITGFLLLIGLFMLYKNKVVNTIA